MDRLYTKKERHDATNWNHENPAEWMKPFNETVFDTWCEHDIGAPFWNKDFLNSEMVICSNKPTTIIINCKSDSFKSINPDTEKSANTRIILLKLYENGDKKVVLKWYDNGYADMCFYEELDKKEKTTVNKLLYNKIKEYKSLIETRTLQWDTATKCARKFYEKIQKLEGEQNVKNEKEQTN